MLEALPEILMDTAGDIVSFVLLFLAGLLFWLLVLLAAAVLLTPIFLILSALGQDPFGERLGSLYRRLLEFW